MKGFTAGRKEDKLGWRASDTRELIFQDVEVPAENLLGEEGQGFINFMQTLDSGRIGIAALSLGIAEGAFDLALRYSTQRKQFGHPISEFQAIQFQLADSPRRSRPGGTSCTTPPGWPSTGRPYGPQAAMAKLFCSELAMRATHRAVQVHGGYGYTQGLPGGAHDARREDLRDRGGDERDPADGDRPASAEAARATSARTAARPLYFSP